MPNAKIAAAFAQRRDYQYNGKHVDQQDHLGFDMASVEHDAVPASNSGVVLLARYFGIFGNAVVTDHGYDLMTPYRHLSALGVHQAQHVHRRPHLARPRTTLPAARDQ